MITNELQLRIHKGDAAAFKTLYNEKAKGVYKLALSALKKDEKAKEVVKCTFLTLRQEMLSADGPVDVNGRIKALSEQAIKNALAPLTGVESAENPAAGPATNPTGEISYSTTPTAAALPPLERAFAYMKSDPDQPPVKGDSSRALAPAPSRRGGAVVLKCLIVLFLLLFIWMLVGILMDMHILPAADWGYSWFNRNIFALFNV